jgi:glycosyltransferase involved in cell wall biosynthesis
VRRAIETSGAVAWTVVHPSADDGPAMRNLAVLMDWLARQPDVELHTVLWLPGWASTAPFRVGTFHDVARDHRGLLPRAARRMGDERRAGALTARAARSNLATVPPTGFVYLNGAASGVALRYLPPGERMVVTHLHASDRHDPPLLPERLEHLLAATDAWLADDEATRAWAAEAWGLDPEEIRVVGQLVDLERWDERNPGVDRNRLSLAVAGGPWFSSDHTARLVQSLLRLRPALDLDLLWAEVHPEEHLAPMLHDLDTLGVRDRLHLPTSHEQIFERLADCHVLALTTPADDAPWLTWEAARKGLPVVCFDSHPRAPEVGPVVEGRVVEYLDVVGMAEAVLAIIDGERMAAIRDQESARAERARRDVGALVRGLLERAGGART